MNKSKYIFKEGPNNKEKSSKKGEIIPKKIIHPNLKEVVYESQQSDNGADVDGSKTDTSPTQ